MRQWPSLLNRAYPSVLVQTVYEGSPERKLDAHRRPWIKRCGPSTAAVDVFLKPTDYLPFATQRSLGDILDGLLDNLSGGVNRTSGSEQAFRREVRNITEDDLVLRI